MAWQRTAPNPAAPQTGTNSWTRFARRDLFRLFTDPGAGRDRDRMVAAINRLPGRHRLVLQLRLGMDGHRPRAVSEVCDLIPNHGNAGRTTLGWERIRQIEVEAIKMLREAGAL